MSDPDAMSDPDDPWSPELWAIELHYMTFAAFDDLARAVAGIDQDGNLFQPSAKYIDAAFDLLSSGTEIPREEFADHEAEFAAALGAPAERRAELLKAALDNLSDMLGFTPEAPRVIAKFKLPEDPQA